MLYWQKQVCSILFVRRWHPRRANSVTFSTSVLKLCPRTNQALPRCAKPSDSFCLALNKRALLVSIAVLLCLKSTCEVVALSQSGAERLMEPEETPLSLKTRQEKLPAARSCRAFVEKSFPSRQASARPHDERSLWIQPAGLVWILSSFRSSEVFVPMNQPGFRVLINLKARLICLSLVCFLFAPETVESSLIYQIKT